MVSFIFIYYFMSIFLFFLLHCFIAKQIVFLSSITRNSLEVPFHSFKTHCFFDPDLDAKARRNAISVARAESTVSTAAAVDMAEGVAVAVIR